MIVVFGTILTRAVPFFVFPDGKTPPAYIRYLKDSFSGSFHGLPELIAILCIAVIHKWKKNTLLSIGAGTAIYMMLVQVLF